MLACGHEVVIDTAVEALVEGLFVGRWVGRGDIALIEVVGVIKAAAGDIVGNILEVFNHAVGFKVVAVGDHVVCVFGYDYYNNVTNVVKKNETAKDSPSENELSHLLNTFFLRFGGAKVRFSFFGTGSGAGSSYMTSMCS